MLNNSLLVALMVGFAGEPARPGPAVEARIHDGSDAFFAAGTIPRLHLRVEPEELKKLQANPREYVHAALREDDGPVVADVALKLKGAAGSFRPWDERPALTINMKKFNKPGRFHDLEKFHLNNSVQDETYLNEILSADLFHRGGIPTPRVTHARVWINDRDVGFYVFKEGFDKLFLKRYYEDPRGNLYDGGFLQDLDANLEKDEGEGPDDRRDLRAIVAAAATRDRTQRGRKLEGLVDMDEFCTFMAIERLIGHWDGYVDKANNYRIYFDPKLGKAVFLPHGMDQVFGDPDANLLTRSEKIVGYAVKQSPELWRRYQAQLERSMPLVAPADDLIRRLDEVDRRIRPVIQEFDPSLASRRADQVAGLRDRLVARANSLRRQLSEPREFVVTFNDKGVAALTDWKSQVKSGAATIDEADMKPGIKALRIQAGGTEPIEASWRCRVTLEAGRYTLKTEMQSDKVVPWNQANGGVGVRISGTPRGKHMTGSVARSPVNYQFQVLEAEQQVELVLELRAVSGQVWFKRDSLQLTWEKLRPGR